MEEAKEICPKCNKRALRITKGFCHNCYRKFLWKQKLITCKRCKQLRKNHAFGFCDGCYNSIFHIEKVKEQNTINYHNISHELYKQITKKCVICGFDKIVDLHHLDLNHENNSQDNLIGLCPNHHKMLHTRNYTQEIFKQLEEKGYSLPKVYKDDEFYKNNITPTIHKKRFLSQNQRKLES